MALTFFGCGLTLMMVLNGRVTEFLFPVVFGSLVVGAGGGSAASSGS